VGDDDLLSREARPKASELSWPQLIVGLVIVLGIIGAVVYYSRDVTVLSLGATGNVRAAGYTIDADGCTTGERSHIEMVEARNNPLGGVRIDGRQGGSVFVDAEGKRVVVTPPSCSSDDCRLELTEERCRVFRVTIGWTGNKTNNRDIWAGRVELTCDLDDGLLTATLDFPGCA